MTINYDRIAPFYEFLSKIVFGNSLYKSQIHNIGKIPPNSNVLIIGGGAGKFLPELLKNPNCKSILFLESSLEMLKLCRETIYNNNFSGKIEFRHGTEKNLLPEERFNIIITYYFLDLYQDNELDSLIKLLKKFLTPDGIWLVADFRINKHGIHKIWQHILIKILYLFFKFTTGMKTKDLSDLQEYLSKNCLIEQEVNYYYTGMIFTSIFKNNSKNYSP